MTATVTSSECVRIVLVEPQRMLRDGLRRLLDAEHELLVVGEGASAADGITLTLRHDPDIVLLGVAARSGNGIAALGQIRAASRATRVVLMTGATQDSELLRAFHLGAHGVVWKTDGARELLASIRSVHGGNYFVGREAMADLIAAVDRLRDATRHAVVRTTPDTPFGLTDRERQIVAAVVDASANKQIAEQFAISKQTVKHHLTNIFNKVGVSSRLELALFARHHHLVSTHV